MLGRDDQAADIQAARGDLLDGKSDDRSSGSDQHIPGGQPEGMNVGDLKPSGL